MRVQKSDEHILIHDEDQKR